MEEYFDESDECTNDQSYNHCSPDSSHCPSSDEPYARITEQPAKCGVRFRYECEGRISGAIPGVHSTTLQPTYPTIRLFNYSGRARIVVSCVTKNPPFRAHPHNLVGKKSCKDGVCSLVFSDSVCAFNNLGILCAKRKDIRERLKVREALGVDPFGTGFGHKSQAFKIIDLAVIRLCFQVYLEGPHEGQFDVALEPLVSDPIYDKKAMSELSIAKLSHYSAPVTGGTDIILLCDRVIKDDIQIRFFEEREDRVVWEAFADFKANDIHKHFAISFRSPKYCDLSVCQPIPVNIQLKRPSDGGTSESLPFYLLPKQQDHQKRQRMSTRQHRQRPMAPSALLMPLTGDPQRVEEKPTLPDTYILPRSLLLCSSSQQQYNTECANTLCYNSCEDFLSQTNDSFIDFDINCIQIDENCNEFPINPITTSTTTTGGHFWPEEQHKTSDHQRMTAEIVSPSDHQNIQLLDISANGVQRLQWTVPSCPPPAPPLPANQSKTTYGISC